MDAAQAPDPSAKGRTAQYGCGVVRMYMTDHEVLRYCVEAASKRQSTGGWLPLEVGLKAAKRKVRPNDEDWRLDQDAKSGAKLHQSLVCVYRSGGLD
ncbi:hypothetical protein UY3_11214 [Chelonia mydas]|uniref:Uncharacterized protein n=1 Tax=Chelonia mydas TaxID=8469 RepID=M7B7Y7_CHEMY|nr:hypothetical protein UY3_11214 [Chelonia mydas]